MEDRKEKNGARDLLLILLWITLVCALGFFALNQSFKFFYGIHLLKSPCDLCAELNPGVQDCIDNLNAPRASYSDGVGGWSDPFEDPNNIGLKNYAGPVQPGIDEAHFRATGESTPIK